MTNKPNVMKKFCYLFLFTLLPLLAFGQTRYVDLASFGIIGRASTASATPYCRLPDSLRHQIRKPLWDLSRSTAGLSVRFRTNSSRVSLKWENLNGFHMDHMTNIGVRGFDLYTLLDNGTWHYAGVARVGGGKYGNTTMVKNMKPEWREYMLFLPLYDGVVKAEIGIDSTAAIEPARVNDPVQEKPIVFYGTSILQGGCASRPGMAFTNIVQRRLHRECINLGFSGNGRLDLAVARVMAHVDASAYVIDCLPNATVQEMRDSMVNFYRIIREAHPRTPILFVEDPQFTYAFIDRQMGKEVADKNACLDSIYARISRCDKHVQLLRSERIIGTDGEACVDGQHFTDLGMMRYADTLTPILSSLIKRHR